MDRGEDRYLRLKLFLLSILSILGLGPLHQAGYTGEGITIAVIDGGFFGVDQDSIAYPKDHIIGWKDFLNDSSFFQSTTEVHGAMVLSTMLTERDEMGERFGTAPGAHYFLIRTEDSQKEYPEEMDNLARGIRYADSIGADIITISLGYRLFDDPKYDFTYDSINGQSAVSRAATEAARHNRLLCVAAGNDGRGVGESDWKWVSAPGDADSILTVGAVGLDSLPGQFSSYGPTADGRKKPEVSAWGVDCIVYSTISQSFNYSNGTSFATPRIAGMAACIWQAMPQLTAMELRQLIIESASAYPEWDAQAGYGIPNANAICHLPEVVDALPESTTDGANAAPVYYNIQGIRLDAEPQHGFYIEVRGNKARKVMR